jgi:hypothetical protein
MKPAGSSRQRGATLLAMLLIVATGASWFLVSRLNADSGSVPAVNRARNAQVLNRAKQALIGYIAQQAATSGENNPGRLPCPEAVNNIGTINEGSSAPWIGPPATSTCNSIGRLPWRTLGLDKLVDSTNEPLWYVVGPSWRLTNSSSTLLINSNATGDITVDGTSGVVALIIAPGQAMNVQAATGCTARNQARSTPSPTMNALDYIECVNTGTLSFVTTAASTSFNDQVMRITASDVMPAIEAAIAKRIEREIVPALNSVYVTANWGIPGSNPVYPYAAQFANPGPGTGSSNYWGASANCVSGVCKGLLPFNEVQGCTVASSNPRCIDPTTVFTFSKSGSDATIAGSGSIRTQSACAWSGSVYICTGEYNAPSISLTLSFKVTNIAMGLRALDTSKVTCTAVDDVGNGLPTQTVACSTSAVLQTDGSAIFTVTTAALPDVAVSGWGTYANYMINIDRAAITDHSLLDTATATSTSWFARNEWYRLTYYAVVQGHTVGTLPPSCTTGTNCLSVSNVTPTSAQRAILILGGRSVNSSSRPSSTLTDYLESGNATGAFTRKTVSASVTVPAAQRFNDRIVVVGSN